MTLTTYRNRRDFRVSPEPAGGRSPASKSAGIYVIQKHRASQLHYGFRLEFGGRLLSWAVPKAPSPDPAVKRLAIEVEDHPIEYASFEGIIPEGEYGGGTVMIWDRGTWIPDDEDVDKALKKGELKFTLNGQKLQGSWVLVRTRAYGHNANRSWLLIKHRDGYASKEDIASIRPRSVVSNRLLADIAREAGGNIEKAATGDPKATRARAKASRASEAVGKRQSQRKPKTGGGRSRIGKS
jgi:bifunctional non-homologous end joining protein LigD